MTTFIGTLPAIIVAATGLIVVLRKIEQVHKATNSMKDALVTAALAEGKSLGIKEERDRKTLSS